VETKPISPAPIYWTLDGRSVNEVMETLWFPKKAKFWLRINSSTKIGTAATVLFATKKGENLLFFIRKDMAIA
jgi:hypothetical protein